MAHYRGLSSLDLTNVDVEGGPGAARLDDDYFVGLPFLSSTTGSSEADLPWTAAGPTASSSSSSRQDTLSLASLLVAAKQQLGHARAGWGDSLRWRQVGNLVVESKAVRMSMIKGLILSSVVVLVIFFFELYVCAARERLGALCMLTLDPSAHTRSAFFPSQLYLRNSRKAISTPSSADDSTPSSTWSETSNVLWLYPVIAISYYMASSWTLDVAKTAYQLRHHSRAPSTWANSLTPSASLRRRLLSQSYQPLLFLNYALLALLVRSYVPYLGPTLAFALVSLVDAYYCFDPVMASRGWPIERRLRYVESRWSYMAAFGLLPTAVSYFHPSGLVNLFLFMAVYPWCTVLALLANPVPRQGEISKGGSGGGAIASASAWLPARIPLFLPTAILYRIVMRFAPPASSEETHLAGSASRYAAGGGYGRGPFASTSGKTPGVAAYGGAGGGAANGFYSAAVPAYGATNGASGYGQDGAAVNGWAGGGGAGGPSASSSSSSRMGGAGPGAPLGRRTAAQFVGGVWQQGQGPGQAARAPWGAAEPQPQPQQPYAAFNAATAGGPGGVAAAQSPPARRAQQVHLPQQGAAHSPDTHVVPLNGAPATPASATQYATAPRSPPIGKVGPPPKGPARGGGGKKMD